MDELVPLSNEELLRRLRDPEDNFTERKPSKQFGDWLQTMVGLANSTPPGYPAVLFAGVENDGTPQGTDPDKIQSQISSIAKNAYPEIFHVCKVLEVDGKPVVAVIVPGSLVRPHFAGKSYVRVGHQTMEASEEQFAALIAIRQSKAFALQEHIGKPVSLWHFNEGFRGQFIHKAPEAFILTACNAHYLTIESLPTKKERWTESTPLEWVEISFDHRHDRLALCLSLRISNSIFESRRPPQPPPNNP